jgi:anion-transporting  ArsA/GET3 family ATPase
MNDWLSQSQIIVCVGCGGVGKTTLSAALGYRAATAGRRVLVLTVDPARRLKEALGMGGVQGMAQIEVSGSGSLEADMVDPKEVLSQFVRRSSPDPAIANQLLGNRLYAELTSVVSGTHEFAALERLLCAAESGKYDLIVLDTPPAQHAIDFLKAPQRIYDLFQDSVVRWFLPERKDRLLDRLFQQGTRRAIDALELITGSGFFREISDFYAAAALLQNAVSARSIEVHRLLASDKTAFVLVTSYDDGKIFEALELGQDLRQMGHQLCSVLVNRSAPTWLGITEPAAELPSAKAGVNKLALYRETLQRYYVDRQTQFRSQLSRLIGQVSVLEIPELSENIDGTAGLRKIAGYLGTEKR